jgi:hypothetical protein
VIEVKKKINFKLLSGNLLDDQYAQSETVFRLMIDSIIGLAILIIIVSAINYYNEQSCQQSIQDLIELVKSSAHASNGAIIPSSGDICFSKGSGIDALDAQLWTNVSENCFRFQSLGSVAAKISPDEKKIDFTQNLKTKVYVQCKPSLTVDSCDPSVPAQTPEACCITCTISIGKKIENE